MSKTTVKLTLSYFDRYSINLSKLLQRPLQQKRSSTTDKALLRSLRELRRVVLLRYRFCDKKNNKNALAADRVREPIFGVVMYVYLLRSIRNPNRRYIGLTIDLERRLAEHNDGKTKSTAQFRPWKVAVSVWFESELKAQLFEQYLKRGSGHAFARRHFF